MNMLKKSLALVSLLCLLSFLPGCMRDAVAKYRQAKIHMLSQEYEMAIPLFKECLNYNHENPEIHFYLGKCYEELGDLDSAIWHLELGAKFNPSYHPGQMSLIRLLAQNGQPLKSVETARMYFSHKNDTYEFFMAAGDELIAGQLPDQAAEAYESAVRDEPHNPAPYMKLADYYYLFGNTEKGDQYLIKAFKIDPYYPGLSRRMGEKGIKTNMPAPPPQGPPMKPLSMDSEE